MPEVATDALFRVVGRDFGYANTISLSVAKSETPIDLVMMRTKIDLLNDKDWGLAIRATQLNSKSGKTMAGLTRGSMKTCSTRSRLMRNCRTTACRRTENTP